MPPVLFAAPDSDCIAQSHRDFLNHSGIMEQVVQGIGSAKEGKMRFGKNPPRKLGLNQPAYDGIFIVHWSTCLDPIVQELGDISIGGISIGQHLAMQLEDALLEKKVWVAIAEYSFVLNPRRKYGGMYEISSYYGFEEYSFLIMDVHDNQVVLKAVHVIRTRYRSQSEHDSTILQPGGCRP